LHSIGTQFRRKIPRGNQFIPLRISAGPDFFEILGFRRQDFEHLARGTALGRGLQIGCQTGGNAAHEACRVDWLFLHGGSVRFFDHSGEKTSGGLAPALRPILPRSPLLIQPECHCWSDSSRDCFRLALVCCQTTADWPVHGPNSPGSAENFALVGSTDSERPAAKHAISGMAAGWAGCGADLIPDGDEEEERTLAA
jgi:hypothetical protein